MLRFSSFLAELASKHLANFRLRYSNTQTKFDLRWFTHTIPYHQWSVHEKRPGSFIWYPTKDHLDLGAMVAANEATFDILYFDCSGDTATISSSGTVSSSSRKIMSNTAAVITWSLFSQALCNRCPSVAELGGCLLDIIRGHPQLFVDSSERWEVSLQALEGLFDTEVNVNTDCQIIVILDHVDAIERNQLKDLRSFMRQSRCLFIGMSNSETRLELQGIPSVDEDTEYHGKVQITLKAICANNKCRILGNVEVRKDGTSTGCYCNCRDWHQPLDLVKPCFLGMERSVIRTLVDTRKTRQWKVCPGKDYSEPSPDGDRLEVRFHPVSNCWLLVLQ